MTVILHVAFANFFRHLHLLIASLIQLDLRWFCSSLFRVNAATLCGSLPTCEPDDARARHTHIRFDHNLSLQ
jgi:hypothetical protein